MINRIIPHSSRLVTLFVCSLPTYFLVFAEIFSSTLKMEAIGSSETSVATQQITRRHIPEDDSLLNHRCVNLKSYNSPIVACVFFTAVTFLPNRCLATIGGYTDTHTHTQTATWSHKPTLFFQNTENRLQISVARICELGPTLVPVQKSSNHGNKYITTIVTNSSHSNRCGNHSNQSCT
jgi:hypothetical protein